MGTVVQRCRSRSFLEAYQHLALRGEPVSIFELRLESGLPMSDLSGRLLDLALTGKAKFFDSNLEKYSPEERRAAVRHDGHDWMLVRIDV